MIEGDTIQFSFDVFSFDGERWSLDGSFSMTQKDEALKLAQRLYARPHIKGVRIIQETFDRDMGGSARKALFSRTKTEELSDLKIVDILLEPKLASA
ncbi:MAG TPA: hypothetical protein VMQ11_02160 [Alphaproteobacteria bacterium]|nr:hypothetical protein [Alphaproteobacteria bacterium]